VQLTLFSVGRMKSGPERELFDRYMERASRLAPSLGFAKPALRETIESRADTSKRRKTDEAMALGNLVDERQSRLLLFDERGTLISSDEFSSKLTRWRDDGIKQTILAIGGPDGFAVEARARADAVISFGRLTIPHQIVRVLVAEQLYRAMTIAANHPYHRL